MKNDEIKKIIINSFRENKNSHAFLFETNNIQACYDDIIDIVKKANCTTGKDDCDCELCHLIDSGTSPDLISIKPDGREIKVNQVLEMMERFETLPSVSKYNMYIVENADKLNASSANKILKFLEEPEEHIVGFYITDNVQAILPTIKSRCEVYTYNFEINNILDLLNINEEQFAMFETAIELVEKLNDDTKFKLMVESKKISSKERSDIEVIIKLIRQMYIIKYQSLMYNKYQDLDFIERILKAIQTDDIPTIVKRIKIIGNIIEDLQYNVNKDLIINKLFLEWE